MKAFKVRYYADWNMKRIVEKCVFSLSFNQLVADLRHIHPINQNAALLIDITAMEDN